jgi:hypothetical protein
MSTFFNRRAFVSLSILIFFIVIFITSVLMFFKPHTPLVALVHTGIGFLLLAIAIWHLKNNFSSLKTYFKLRQSKSGAAFGLALPIAVLCGATLLGLAITQSAPFLTLYEWGNKLRTGEKSEEKIQFSYVRVNHTKVDAQGNKLVIDLRKGPYFRWPQYAFWLETMDGEFIQPLYITEKLAHNKFVVKQTLRDKGEVLTSDVSSYDDETWGKVFAEEYSPETADQRVRPESLPVFLHQLNSKTPDNIFSPADQVASKNTSNKKNATDAFAGATILDNFLLSSRSNKSLPDKYRIRFEINQAFDFNKYYSSDRFPDDPIYSGNGYSAQPSVIYEAIVDAQTSQQYYPMTLIGRGHHSGADGKVYTDIDNLTSAKEIVDRIIVEVKRD